MKKIGFLNKFISNRRYINEVPIEGKSPTTRIHTKLGYHDYYIEKVINAGNCLTLLSNKFEITEESFWNITHFEDYAKYVFWTFNKIFLLKQVEAVETKKLSILQRIQELLVENPVAYGFLISETTEGEVMFCYKKNASLKKAKKFDQMYILDKQNREKFLSAVEKRIAEFPLATKLEHIVSSPPSEGEPEIEANSILFMEVLRPLNGKPENTLQFIIDKTEQAGFEYKLFTKVPKLPNNKNPYGFNGCTAAMIEFFYQHNYFKKEYSLEEIFKTYLQYSGNSIGKFKTFLSEFREDNSFIEHYSKLNALKISKLS